jgi:hypothetical protein
MGFDIRTPLGVMFAILGLLLAGSALLWLAWRPRRRA